MKQFLLRATLLCTMAFGLTLPKAEAQFFKKLGKAIEKIDKATSQTRQTKQHSSTSTSNQGGVTATCKIPGLKVNYQGVTIEDGQQVISFTLTNSTNKVIEINNFEKTNNFDFEGKQPYSRTAIGNKVTSLGNGDFKFEPGIPVKCKIFLVETPLSVKGLKLAQIRTQQFDNGWHERYIEFHNVDLTQAKVVSGPFFGKFKVGKVGVANLNLYKPTIDCTDYDNSGKYKQCYGTFDIDPTGDGLRIEQSFIVRAQISLSTYEAVVDYVGGRDGCVYRMQLSYDPTWKNLKIKHIEMVEGMDEEYQETYLEPSLSLVPTK